VRDFFKDQLSFILFFYSQCALIIGVAQISAMTVNASLGPDTIIYLFVLTTCCLIGFLLYRYYKFQAFYTKKQSNVFQDPPNRLLEKIKAQREQETNDYAAEVEQLKQQQQLEFNFIQQWVHQMKTPVSVMHLTLQKDKLLISEAFYRSMLEELERLQQGLDLALYQSRLQKFDRDFFVEKLDLKEMVKEVISDLKSSFIRSQVFPSLDIESNTIVATDSKWFRFVLTQIISNAIKYSKETSDKIYFTVKVKSGTIRLDIRDTGHGIPTQDIHRIFDPFFTGLNGRKFRESTGMGLYLSKEICDHLGHDLHVTSQKDIGTTVTITFNH
jgi:signal transduction histidine kinase